MVPKLEEELLNIENIRALAKKMRRLRHEEHYDQGTWVQQTECGTACCLAGHAAMLGGSRPLTKRDRKKLGHEGDGLMKTPDAQYEWVQELGGQFLGIDEESWLFTYQPDAEGRYPAKWPAEYALRWRAALRGESDERPSRIAADLLDAIADGEVSL